MMQELESERLRAQGQVQRQLGAEERQGFEELLMAAADKARRDWEDLRDGRVRSRSLAPRASQGDAEPDSPPGLVYDEETEGKFVEQSWRQGTYALSRRRWAEP